MTSIFKDPETITEFLDGEKYECTKIQFTSKKILTIKAKTKSIHLNDFNDRFIDVYVKDVNILQNWIENVAFKSYQHLPEVNRNKYIEIDTLKRKKSLYRFKIVNTSKENYHYDDSPIKELSNVFSNPDYKVKLKIIMDSVIITESVIKCQIYVYRVLDYKKISYDEDMLFKSDNE